MNFENLMSLRFIPIAILFVAFGTTVGCAGMPARNAVLRGPSSIAAEANLSCRIAKSYLEAELKDVKDSSQRNILTQAFDDLSETETVEIRIGAGQEAGSYAGYVRLAKKATSAGSRLEKQYTIDSKKTAERSRAQKDAVVLTDGETEVVLARSANTLGIFGAEVKTKSPFFSKELFDCQIVE